MDDLQDYFSTGPKTVDEFIRWMAVFLPSMEGTGVKFNLEFKFDGDMKFEFNIGYRDKGDMTKIAERIEAANVAMLRGVQ
jgi:hypothetical protein